MRTATGLLIVGSSSPISIPPPPKHPLTTTHNKLPPNHSKPPAPPPPSSSSQSHRPPLLTTVRLDHHGLQKRLNYYADLASKLAEDGKFDDFLMIAETVTSGSSGVKASEFAALLNVGVVAKGIVKVVEIDRDLWSVIRVLDGVGKLGIVSTAVGLFDRSVVEAIGRELRRILMSGEVEEVVDMMETLAGFKFPVERLVEPIEIIKCCVRGRNPNVAIRYARFSAPSDELFCSVILEFGKKGDLASALSVFEASKDHLGCVNMYAYRAIIDVCGLCRKHLQSRSIYEELHAHNINPNLYVFNSLMNVNACDLSYTIHIYKHMQNIGVAPDMASYNILLKSCCLAARVDLAQEIYKEVELLDSKGSLKLDVFTYTTMVKVFTDARMWQMALGIKEKMLEAGVTPNTVTWSSLISACANAGLVDQAFRLFEEMIQTGCEPNSQCCNALLNACVKACQYDRAFRLFHSWKENTLRLAFGDDYSKADRNITGGPQVALKVPFAPTVSTYNVLMKACGTDHHRAKALMDEMKAAGLSPNLISWSTLIGVYGGSGDVASAVQILKTMRESRVQPDVIAYTAAIKVCVKHKELKLAFSLYAEMKRYRLQPNMVTYNTLLGARTRYGSVQEVQQCLGIYQDMRKAGYKPNDYYLKELIEEWCEGIIQSNHHSQGQPTSSERRDLGRPHSLLLEKVAAHLQKGNADTQHVAVDLRGLTKVEARIVVLAVLRMIKENYTPGAWIEDDMFIIFGNQETGAAADKHKFDVKDTIIKLLQDDLSLEVLSLEPNTTNETKITVEKPFKPNPNLEKPLNRHGRPTEFTSLTRRPAAAAVLQWLKVPRRSLYKWLQRKANDDRRQVSHTNNRVIL